MENGITPSARTNKFQKLRKVIYGQALKKKEAQVQRPLWASTGTKNPHYSDVLYVESLIAPDTVSTIPPETWTAFRNHGTARASLEENIVEAEAVLPSLKRAGIDLSQVTAGLEAAGVKAFADSFSALMRGITAKMEAIRSGTSQKTSANLGAFQKQVNETLKKIQENRVAARLWSKDPSLWKKDPKHEAAIKNGLGWLAIPESMLEKAGDLSDFAEEVRGAGFTHILLLGMGGSSLAPEVFCRTFPPKPGFPKLLVLDSTEPEAVAEAEQATDPKRTLYIVSSKSGTTTEPLRFFDYFYSRVQSVKGKSAGESFIAITDPGTPLEKLAHEKGFRKIFLNPADIGGRYSALSYFGLVPAALMGLDVHTFLDRASRMIHACPSCVPLAENPGLWLGAVIGTLAKAGRDKLTFLISPEISALGLWLEQLLAESTGKEGKGVIPISGEPLEDFERYGKDRAFVSIRLSSSKDASLETLSENLVRTGHPVIRINLDDKMDLGAEFYRWEIATAVIGHILGINAFDQPNVQEAKDLTRKLLDGWVQNGSFPELEKVVTDENLSLSFSKASRQSIGSDERGLSIEDALHDFLEVIKPGDYIGLQAYLSSWGKYDREMESLREQLLRITGVPVQFGYGPRYLHSTGQLHKGGPNTGAFIFLVTEDQTDLRINGSGCTFGQLVSAQSLGDFQALDASGRRAVYIRIQGDPKRALQKLSKAFETAFRPALQK